MNKNLLAFGALNLASSFARADLSLETESARILAPGKVEVSAATEFQTSNNSGDEFALPLAIEIGVLSRVELLIEPTVLVSISPETGKKVNGVGDTELTVNCLAFDETESLPAIAFGLEWKAPTARELDIGTKKSDFAFYVIGSKRIGALGVNAHLTYTIIGEPKDVSVKNTWAVSVSGDYKLSPTWDVFAEATGTSSAANGSSSENGGGGGEGGGASNGTATAEVGGSETIGTVGVRAHLATSLDLFGSLSYDNSHAALLRTGMTWRF